MAHATSRSVGVFAVIAAAVIVSACGGSSTGDHAGHDAVAAHNAADVTFVEHMLPHHRQALDLVAMVPTSTTNWDVLKIANRIKADQKPEIRSMEGWLAQWGETATAEHPGHQGHDGTRDDGMVDPMTMNQLESLRGPDFDTLWVESMIAHHEGAVRMARAEIAGGQAPDVLAMATLMVTKQEKEIAYMKQLVAVPE